MGGIINTIINAIPEPLKNQAVAILTLTLLGLPAPVATVVTKQAQQVVQTLSYDGENTQCQQRCITIWSNCKNLCNVTYDTGDERNQCNSTCDQQYTACTNSCEQPIEPTPTPIRCEQLSDNTSEYQCQPYTPELREGWDCNNPSRDLCSSSAEICCHRLRSPSAPTSPPSQPTRPPAGDGQPQQCTGELDFSCNGNDVTLNANWNLTTPPEGDGNCNVYITKDDGSLAFDGFSRQSCQSSTTPLTIVNRNEANGKEFKLFVSNGQAACLNRDVSTKRVVCGGSGPLPSPPPPTATPWPGSPSLPPGRTAPTPVRLSPTPNGRVTPNPRNVACNASDISFEVTPTNPNANQPLTFTVHGNALVYREDTYLGGGFNNCQASGRQWQCTPTQSGNVTWTHRWRVCEGSTNLASCSEICTKDFTFAVGSSSPSPTPTPSQTISPTPTPTAVPSRTPTPTVNPNGLCNSFCNRFVDQNGTARNPNPLACAQAGLVFTPIKQGGNYSAPNACGSYCARCPAGQTISSDGCRCEGGSPTTPTAAANPSASATRAPTLAPGDSWIVELVNCMLEYTGRVNTLSCDHTGSEGRPNGRVEQDDVIFVINRIRTQQ